MSGSVKSITHDRQDRQETIKSITHDRQEHHLFRVGFRLRHALHKLKHEAVGLQRAACSLQS